MAALVIAEHDNASIKAATLNTVTAAIACGGDVHVLVAGANAAEAAKAAAQIAGVAKVLHADGAQFAHGLAENVAAQVLALAKDYSHILFPRHRRAARTSLRAWRPSWTWRRSRHHEGGQPRHLRASHLRRQRHCHGAECDDKVKVLTVRTTAFDPAAATGGTGKVEALPASPTPARACSSARKSRRATAPS
jgi:electron transfer flavoprotein alpha subunit